ncbi:MAG: hypothetical protein OEW88_05035 [Gammaproteobacteria bacterium]|nr:hypothetical protein [Gammaproteobacteria bacterium]
MQHSVPQRPGATQGPGPLSRLERTVLAALLQGEGEEFAALRAQLARATVASRTHSGVGFVTRLAVPDEVPALAEGASPRLRPVLAAHPRLAERAEFLLQLRGGRLAVLEAYCYEGGWPADEAEFRVVV